MNWIAHHKIEAALFLIVFALATTIGAGYWGFSYDDAFITYTYSQNWLEGRGLAHNDGRAVFGTTAPGYALLLGILARLSAPLSITIPAWGTIISLLSLTIIPLIIFLSTKGVSRMYRLGVPFLFGTISLTLQWNIEMLGSETLPLIALVAMAIYQQFERNRTFWAGLLLVLAMVLRLDAALAAMAVGLVSWWHYRRFPWGFCAIILFPLSCWLLFLFSHFGQVIPVTLAGKQSEFAAALQDYTLAEWRWLRRTLPLASCVTLLSLALLGLGRLFQHRFWRNPALLTLAVWVLSHEITYRLVRVPFSPWYQEITLNATVALAALGALICVDLPFLRNRLHPTNPNRAAITRCLISLVLVTPILVPSLGYVTRHWGRPPDPRFRIYTQIGRFIDKRAAPKDYVATMEVGILGYVSRRPILDLVGLISPEVLKAKEASRLAELVASAAPKYIVDVPGLRPRTSTILAHPNINKNYKTLRRFQTPEYLGGTITLLERTDGAVRQ